MALDKKLKIVFAGTPDFAVPILAALHNHPDFSVKAVITQPDRKSGRGQMISSPPVKVAASDRGIPVLQPKDIREARKDLSDLAPDALVVTAYNQKIPADMLYAPGLGAFNLHASLLPKYRGSSCIQAAILNGDQQTGVTVMQMDEGLDTGPILEQKTITISPEETAGELNRRLAELGSELLPETITAFAQGKIKPKPQNQAHASLVKKLHKDDGRIDWHKEAYEIERLIRAMTPWPGAFSYIELAEKQMDSLKILKASPNLIESNDHKPGEIFDYQGKLAVQTGHHSLEIMFIQPAGKRAMPGRDFLNGNRHLLGKALI
jgi:methionyl-tRNA formyltransferase